MNVKDNANIRLPLYTRKDFMYAALFGIGGSIYALIRKPTKIEPTSKPEDWIKRNGVYIAHESRVIESGEDNIKVTVNEEAFLETIRTVFEKMDKLPEMDTFLKRYPLRINLYAEMKRRAEAYYLNTLGTNNPEIGISTKFIVEYYQYIKEDNEPEITNLESGIVHECWHLGRDATTNLVREDMMFGVGTAWASTMTGIRLGMNMAKRKNELLKPGDGVSEEGKELRIAIGATVGMIAGGLMGLLAAQTVDISEFDAYGHTDPNLSEFINTPALNKLHRKYFSFERQ